MHVPHPAHNTGCTADVLHLTYWDAQVLNAIMQEAAMTHY